MALTLPPASGLRLHFAAWQPNGTEGAGLVSGSSLATWKNRGSTSDAIASEPNQPTWKSDYNRWPAVNFDSVSDIMTVPGSISSLNFIHETAVFDIFVAVRGAVNKYGVIAGNAFNLTDTGFLIERVHNVAGAPLTFYLFLGPGGGYRYFPTSGYWLPVHPSFEPGVANKMLFRCSGVGTRLQASQDFSTFFTTSGGGAGAAVATVPTGNATLETSIGGVGGSYFYGGEIMDVIIYDRNLSAGELSTMSTYFSERYGF